MGKLNLLFLLLFGFVQLSEAQNETVSRKFLEMKQYEKDPSAPAVIIKDKGVCYLNMTNDEFEIVFKRECEIKIFTRAGLKYAEFAIPYYEETNNVEKISNLQGFTFNLENGLIRKTPLDLQKTYKEKISENHYEKKFAMPDVKEGSVINVSYEFRSPFVFHFQDWDFQYRIPVIYSEYEAKMNPFYEYSYILQGASKFDVFENHVENSLENSYRGLKYKNMIYHFAMKDVPAFEDESYITSMNDFKINLNFQLSAIHRPDGSTQKVVSTWPKLSAELLENEHFGRYIKSAERKSKEITDTMKLDSKTDLEKAKCIERFVKTNFNWNNRNTKYVTSNIKDFLNQKTGNSADINLFLIGMLNAAGIETTPVILSTRANGKIKVDYPFERFFNYVIAAAKINGKTILLDATEPFCGFGEIPTRCFNDRGLVVQKKEAQWIEFHSNTPSQTEFNFNFTLNSTNDSIRENCKLFSMGYDAVKYRNQYSSSYKDLRTELLGANALPEDSLKAISLTNIDKPFTILYERKKPLEKIEDKIIIDPFCNTTLKENPLKQPTRSYPVDMTYKSGIKYVSTIKIPAGYKLLVRPESMNFEDDLIKISFFSDIPEADIIKIAGSYEFKKDVYSSADYQNLKTDFNKIIDKFNEKLVLVKI